MSSSVKASSRRNGGLIDTDCLSRSNSAIISRLLVHFINEEKFANLFAWTMKKQVKRLQTIASIFTVFVTISAWLAVSNHCALGAAAPETKASPDQCPFHAQQSAPQKQKQSNDSPCCKILRATAAAPFKNLANAIGDLNHVDLAFAELTTFAPPKISFHSATLDTGPPGVTSFAELIGSMLTHAPPQIA
jgi:hypothetical protein